MARTAAGLGSGRRTSDFISLGVIAKTFPMAKVHEVLAATGKTSVRQRELPAHVMVYYVIALALFMNASCREVLRCLLEGLQWLKGGLAPIKATGKSGISQARSRLGDEAVRRLHDEIVRPIATPSTKGAWFKTWRLVSLDGSTLDVADEPSLEAAFGRPGAGHGESAYPQIRFVSLVENGTHVLFGTKMAGCATSEIALTKKVLPHLLPGMLCLADRNFFGFEMWSLARATGADLLWRVKTNARLKCGESLPDGSYLSHVYPSEGDRRRATNGVTVRVINYALEGVADAEPLYRLVTTILDPAMASAEELAALYHERWEIETALAELKTRVRGARIVLRSKTEELVRQEFFGMMMLHFAVRGLMHEAALKADEGPTDCRSCMRSESCAESCRCSAAFPPRDRPALHEAVLDEILEERVPPRSHPRNKRGVKRKMSSFPVRRKADRPPPSIPIATAIRILPGEPLRPAAQRPPRSNPQHPQQGATRPENSG